MADTPTLDETLRQAQAGVNNEDVRIFYAYFEELKRCARRHLSRPAGAVPGSSAVAQSALFSLFRDVEAQRIPLSDVDEYGYPMLWPLLLRYVERHCDKWNKWHEVEKRRAKVVSLGGGADGQPGVDPADHRAAPDDEEKFAAILEALSARLSAEERKVLECRLQGESLEQIAARIGRSESTVSNRLNRIRSLLETP
jgi:RNA polymerase sigma factor (sigma-70 family)